MFLSLSLPSVPLSGRLQSKLAQGHGRLGKPATLNPLIFSSGSYILLITLLGAPGPCAEMPRFGYGGGLGDASSMLGQELHPALSDCQMCVLLQHNRLSPQSDFPRLLLHWDWGLLNHPPRLLPFQSPPLPTGLPVCVPTCLSRTKTNTINPNQFSIL